MSDKTDRKIKTGMDLVVGDEVILVAGYGFRSKRRGIVTKVARVWLEITPEGRTIPERYRRDNQTDGSNYSSPPRFLTLDQYAQQQARDAARGWLQGQRIRIDYDSTWDPCDVQEALMIFLAEKARRESRQA